MSLIVFEGIDGCGKDTQLDLLQDAIKFPVDRVREPGSTGVGEEIRNLLKTHSMSPTTQLLLFLAARSALLDSGKLEESEAVILCNRYVASTEAYQVPSVPDGREIMEIFSRRGLPRPDLTIFLDVSPATALSRLATRAKDKLEHDVHMYDARRQNYYKTFSDPWHNAVTIDGEPPPAVVARDILSAIRERGLGHILRN